MAATIERTRRSGALWVASRGIAGSAIPPTNMAGAILRINHGRIDCPRWPVQSGSALIASVNVIAHESLAGRRTC